MLRDRSGRIAMLFACAGCALAAGPLSAAEVLERAFDVGPTGRLRLASDIGTVSVSADSGGRVAVRVLREGPQGEALAVEIVQRGDEIRVIGELPDGDARRDREDDSRVVFEVTVPQDFDVDLSTGGGSIAVDDLEGRVKARTAGGSVRLARLGGPVTARTAGGSISLEASAGQVDLDTAGGSITIERAGGTVHARTAGGSIEIAEAGGAVTARTAGGSIRIGRSAGAVEAQTAGGSITVDDVYGALNASTAGGSITAVIRSQPAGDSRLRTLGGSVDVTLAPGLALDIDARSGNARVHGELDFPADAFGSGERSLRAALNGGGTTLTIRASGTIHLRAE